MRIPRLALLIASVILASTAFTAVGLAMAAASHSASAYPITTISLTDARRLQAACRAGND